MLMIWIDSRRAAFKFNGFTYSSKLVDLPNIIESQKTFDNRHLFKVADISQASPTPTRSNTIYQLNLATKLMICVDVGGG